MIPDALAKALTSFLDVHIAKGCTINGTKYLTGGSINEAYAVNTSCGTFFVKYNYSSEYPLMFETEAKGLKLLADTKTVHVPQLINIGSVDKYDYIILTYHESANKADDFWEKLSHQLAGLHYNKAKSFGLDHDNYIGSLKQSNKPSQNYHSFLIESRFTPLVRSARNKELLNTSDIHHFERFYNLLPELLPSEEPTLIHGDLWSGNLITNKQGNPYLIDPSVYYGNREFDIAMTRLFGGFPPKFYDLYNEKFPLIKGWEKRIEINQLYPLLVHVVLFGLSYAYQVRQIIRKY